MKRGEAFYEGDKFSQSLLGPCYESDALGDPMVNEFHMRAQGTAMGEEIQEIERLSFGVCG